MVSRALALAVPALLALGCTSSPVYAPAEPVEVSPGLWMVPVAFRADGCPMFTQRSDRFAVNHAIYFRQPGGGFTIGLERSECLGAEPTPR